MIENVVNGKTLTFLRRALPVDPGLIEQAEVVESMGETFGGSGLSIGEAELLAVGEATRGYPFMIQLVGYHVWQAAYRDAGMGARVTMDCVCRGVKKARAQFDRMVIEPAL